MIATSTIHNNATEQQEKQEQHQQQLGQLHCLQMTMASN